MKAREQKEYNEIENEKNVRMDEKESIFTFFFFLRIKVEKKRGEFIIKGVTARMWIAVVVLRRQVDKKDRRLNGHQK